MFKVGDHVVYGTSGVCLISDVTPSPFDKRDPRRYYVLKPLSGASTSCIYTPVDNNRVAMRPLIDRAAAAALLAGISEIPCLTIGEERTRRAAYRQAIAVAEPKTYVALIKTVDSRRVEFFGTQRHLPDFEIEYDTVARRHLYTELSIALDRPIKDFDACLAKSIG